MPRFFVKSDTITNENIYIVGDDAYHIARSLRMAVGDALTVSDGEGVDYLCTLTRIRDDECECKIESTHPSSAEPKVKVSLFMAFPKGDKLETVVQKAVELGASEITPFESSRCIKRPKADKVDKQTARLTRIAHEAAKQSGRARLPVVNAPLSYKEMLAEATRADLALFCYEDESATSIKTALKSKKYSTVSVVIGSEGGFSPEEARHARENGCISVTLGPRILRCETAPDYALSAISYETELT
ncbi:MAG: 16S rRNA (uracil(1498)-N(3))-methyltransferase [Clostridia bacterium]|nr:16S rRNA (uracil(1498)-N(3))-methyltransferase [Clostridia bacterium]